LCGSHARRKFFELADIAANARRGKTAPAISPMALEAVKRIDVIFDVERDINGLSAAERLRVRRETVAPLVAALETYILVACRTGQALPSRGHRQSHRLHADALAGLHALPRGWPDLPDQQRRRAGAARFGDA
jgi:hypothetical protein